MAKDDKGAKGVGGTKEDKDAEGGAGDDEDAQEAVEDAGVAIGTLKKHVTKLLKLHATAARKPDDKAVQQLAHEMAKMRRLFLAFEKTAKAVAASAK